MTLLDRLKLPETEFIEDLNAPEATLLHKKIIQSKPFLKRLYLDFYQVFKFYVPDISGKTCIELGSGGGFLKDIYPSVTTSDVLDVDSVDLVFSALEMPFESNSVDAFFMFDVFHHIPDSERFLKEMNRTLKAGGSIVMIEPANTWWGRFIYKNFHHEPFIPEAGWGFEPGGPLTSANGALPWIVFKRDYKKFEEKFPNLNINVFKAHTPIRYLVSGGVSMKQLAPSWSYRLIKGLEWALTPLHPMLGMFYTLHITKQQ